MSCDSNWRPQHEYGGDHLDYGASYQSILVQEVRMATFSTVPMDETRRAVLPPRRATQEQYQEYVRGLTPDAAGQLELGEDDRPITERARLKAAAKAVGKNLHIQRRGTIIVFWETDEPPRTRAKAPAGGGGRRGRQAK